MKIIGRTHTGCGGAARQTAAPCGARQNRNVFEFFTRGSAAFGVSTTVDFNTF
jgi:hypothetical protein